MKPTFRTFAAFALLAPFAFGCASRTAPFNDMDEAQITVLRLQGQYQPPAVQQPAAGGVPQLIPGLPVPPELQQMGQQALQGLQQMLPPGMIPPGLIPGQQGQPQTPVTTPPRLFKNTFVIASERQLTTDPVDEDLREQLLDIFGDEDSFSADRGNCFSPGMGISMVGPKNAVPVDLLISLSCNQAVGDGFRWPYKTNGFTPETRQKLSGIYQQLFGPVPPDA